MVFLTGLVTLSLVPRTLGPEAFGRYEFLTNFFLQVKGFFDMGTSTCFYTRLSQRQGDVGLVSFYHKLLFAASVLMIGGALLLACTPLGDQLWVGEGALLVGLAASYAAVTWWLDTARKIVDARHLTVRGEMLYAFSRIGAALILIAIVFGWSLRIEGYFIYQIATLLLTIVLLTHLLNKREVQPADKIPPQPASTYIREFWDYSHPLIAYAGVGVLV